MGSTSRQLDLETETRGECLATEKCRFGSHINESWSYGSRCGNHGKERV